MQLKKRTGTVKIVFVAVRRGALLGRQHLVERVHRDDGDPRDIKLRNDRPMRTYKHIHTKRRERYLATVVFPEALPPAQAIIYASWPSNHQHQPHSTLQRTLTSPSLLYHGGRPAVKTCERAPPAAYADFGSAIRDDPRRTIGGGSPCIAEWPRGQVRVRFGLVD